MKQHEKIIIISILAFMACVGMASAGLVAGTTSGDGVIPDLIMDNPSCAEAGCNGIDFKIESTSGDYTGTYFIDETHWIKITSFIVQGQTNHNSMNWTSNFDVDCILMKGANGADAYCYNPSVQGDTFLSPPVNPSKKPAAISHINICYKKPIIVPEFPGWFISVMGIACLTGMFVAFQRK
jgi:hypothetical protein